MNNQRSEYRTDGIKYLLLQAVTSGKNNAIHSDRGTGKTTALIDFVATRMILLPENEQVALLAPTVAAAIYLRFSFSRKYPNTRLPVTGGFSGPSFMAGRRFSEIYFDEIFHLSPLQYRDFRSYARVYGVGTMQHPMGIDLG